MVEQPFHCADRHPQQSTNPDGWNFPTPRGVVGRVLTQIEIELTRLRDTESFRSVMLHRETIPLKPRWSLLFPCYPLLSCIIGKPISNMHRHHVAQLHIDFSWKRDQRGYCLLPAEPPKAKPINAMAAFLRAEITFPPSLLAGFDRGGLDPGKPQRIVRCGGNLVAYRPLIEFDGLFRQFTHLATTPAGVLDFIEKFGPLTLDGLDDKQGEDVQTIIENAQIMRRLLDTYTRGDKTALVRLMEPSGIGIGKTEIARIEAALIVDPVTRTPKLQLTVPMTIVSCSTA